MTWEECLQKVANNHSYDNFDRLEWESDRGGLGLDQAYKEASELLANAAVKERLMEAIRQFEVFIGECNKTKTITDYAKAQNDGQITAAMSMKAWVIHEIEQLQYPE